jgi:quercetin dioxygenase-like cupin family protein
MSKITLSDLTQKEILKGFHARMVHTDKMTLSFVEVKAGATLPEHHHMHEQVTHLMEGSFELVLDGKSVVLNPGDVIVIPSNVKHAGRALEHSKLLDVFNPVREDYR